MSEMSTREIQARIENITPEKKRKKRIWNIVFIIFNILVLALVFILNPPQTDESVISILKDTKGKYLVIVALLFLLTILAESSIFYFLVKITTGRRRFRLATKTALMGRYYDNVTPMSTGGQPFQMYTLNKAGVPGAVATSLPLVKYFTFMLLYCGIALYVLLFRLDVLHSLEPASRVIVISASWVGLAINLAIPMFILLCSLIRPLGEALLRFALRIGRALRLVKNHGQAYIKAQNMLTEYQKSLKITAKPFSLLVLTLLNFVSYAATAITPYFIILAFTHGDFNAADMMSSACMTVIILISCSLFPAPGASGAAELSFGVVFSTALSGTFLPVALLTWRFFTFYLYILVGIAMIIAVQLRKKKTVEIVAEQSSSEPVVIPDIQINCPPQEEETLHGDEVSVESEENESPQ